MTMTSPIPGTMLVRETMQGLNPWDRVETYHAVARQGDAQGRHLGVELAQYSVKGNDVERWVQDEFSRSRFEVIG